MMINQWILIQVQFIVHFSDDASFWLHVLVQWFRNWTSYFTRVQRQFATESPRICMVMRRVGPGRPGLSWFGQKLSTWGHQSIPWLTVPTWRSEDSAICSYDLWERLWRLLAFRALGWFWKARLLFFDFCPSFSAFPCLFTSLLLRFSMLFHAFPCFFASLLLRFSLLFCFFDPLLLRFSRLFFLTHKEP